MIPRRFMIVVLGILCVFSLGGKTLAWEKLTKVDPFNGKKTFLATTSASSGLTMLMWCEYDEYKKTTNLMMLVTEKNPDLYGRFLIGRFRFDELPEIKERITFSRTSLGAMLLGKQVVTKKTLSSGIEFPSTELQPPYGLIRKMARHNIMLIQIGNGRPHKVSLRGSGEALKHALSSCVPGLD